MTAIFAASALLLITLAAAAAQPPDQPPGKPPSGPPGKPPSGPPSGPPVQAPSGPPGKPPSGPQVLALPVYDVVTIKPDKQGPGSIDINVNNNLYSASNVSVKDLLEEAYDIRKELISGLTGPIASARFDIQAKIVDPDREVLRKLTDDQRRAMLLPILAERFHVLSHTEVKTLPLFELVVLPGGAKFKPSADQASQDSGISIHNTALTARNIPVAQLAKTLAQQLHRGVVDKTGLPGIYDLELKWSREEVADPDHPDTLPGLMTAVQEQLGLKLQPAKGPVTTLVVDHVEMPGEN